MTPTDRGGKSHSSAAYPLKANREECIVATPALSCPSDMEERLEICCFRDSHQKFSVYNYPVYQHVVIDSLINKIGKKRHTCILLWDGPLESNAPVAAAVSIRFHRYKCTASCCRPFGNS